MSRDARRRLRSAAVVWLSALAVLLALVPLAMILFFVVARGLFSLNLAFFTHMPVPVGEAGGGMANAIVGTLEVLMAQWRPNSPSKSRLASVEVAE